MIPALSRGGSLGGAPRHLSLRQGRRDFISGKEAETPYNMGGRGQCRSDGERALSGTSGRGFFCPGGACPGHAGISWHMEWLRERLHRHAG